MKSKISKNQAELSAKHETPGDFGRHRPVKYCERECSDRNVLRTRHRHLYTETPLSNPKQMRVNT